MNIYLDNAATSFPKPETVYQEMDHYNRNLGVAVGRGQHRAASVVQNRIDQCRSLAAQIFGFSDPKQLAFTFNGTDSLNLALNGLLKRGDHVVTTTLEHNSVTRPLNELQQQLGIEVTFVTANQEGIVSPDDIRNAIQPNTRLVSLIHASNVTGAIQPVEQACEIAHEHGALFLLDAAQTAGHLPIDVQNLPVDFLACPGHKGLLGPLGTGLLYIKKEITGQLRCTRSGGTGTDSEDEFQPRQMPEKFEAGNHNAPSLFGLTAALEYIQDRTIPNIRQHEIDLITEFQQGLKPLPNVTQYGPQDPKQRVGVLSLSIEGFDPQDLSLILDESFQIQTRSGLHCAPGTHKALNTFSQGGTLRFSPGPFTTSEQIQNALAAIKEISAS